MSMLRHRALAATKGPAHLLYSSRTLRNIIYYEELEQLQLRQDGLTVKHTLTRAQPPGWTGYARRIDQKMLPEVVGPLGSLCRSLFAGQHCWLKRRLMV
jgi:ferredoxin-NADP reductase